MTQDFPQVSSYNHSFNVEYAALYGIEVAILIFHFQYWINLNKAKKINSHEGRTWTYQTQEEIAAHFFYWSRDQVQRILNKMVELGIIVKGNFNTNKYDRTTWYAFKNEEIFTIVRNRTKENAESNNQKCETAQPIPNDIPNDKPDLSIDGNDRIIFKSARKEFAVVSVNKSEIIETLSKEKFSLEEIEEAIYIAKANDPKMVPGTVIKYFRSIILNKRKESRGRKCKKNTNMKNSKELSETQKNASSECVTATPQFLKSLSQMGIK
jgi:hypothetical protein